VTNEMRRSAPMTLYLFDGMNDGKHSSFFPIRKAITDGQPVHKALKHYADQVDARFEAFMHDLEAYALCIRQEHDLCRW